MHFMDIKIHLTVFINIGVIVKVYKEDRAIVGVLCTLGPTAY